MCRSLKIMQKTLNIAPFDKKNYQKFACECEKKINKKFIIKSLWIGELIIPMKKKNSNWNIFNQCACVHVCMCGASIVSGSKFIFCLIQLILKWILFQFQKFVSVFDFENLIIPCLIEGENGTVEPIWKNVGASRIIISSRNSIEAKFQLFLHPKNFLKIFFLTIFSLFVFWLKFANE